MSTLTLTELVNYLSPLISIGGAVTAYVWAQRSYEASTRATVVPEVIGPGKAHSPDLELLSVRNAGNGAAFNVRVRLRLYVDNQLVKSKNRAVSFVCVPPGTYEVKDIVFPYHPDKWDTDRERVEIEIMYEDQSGWTTESRFDIKPIWRDIDVDGLYMDWHGQEDFVKYRYRIRMIGVPKRYRPSLFEVIHRANRRMDGFG